ncbi:type I restriction enzyme HsdR N-terminal domain-containing protein [Pontibacter chinhatensis]|uniref:Type I restriction enzyme R protein N terminus (HSDR_N) n=1 Tax=Pontibacter chinhatensis TaxID=1436961 RepID=A0A1I2ZNJ3_9BACT|nr:type I restriction enzyme HsdR N-terminal domain-containing protein [Pontibacter chinhatensis]SFH39314.1 Type I restriction enzyme R protein N terminus (HSDR_N) [Pontibacter chinhatensis]
MNIDLSDFFTTPNYFRNGVSCFLCVSRKKLIQSTPEEKVRQALIYFLVNRLDFPADRILVEVPMSHYAKGVSGRADIVVLNKEGIPVMVVECKEENSDVTDEAIAQARRYEGVVKSGAILVTNGLEAYCEVMDGTAGYKPLGKIPSYRNLTKWRWFSFKSQKPRVYKRPPFLSPIPQPVVDMHVQQGWLGEDTLHSLYPFIFNLTGWLFDERDRVAPASITASTLLEDGGIRRSQFGNAGGGKFSGEYRYFVIKDENGNNQILSLSIFGGAKTVSHPRWGNRKGYTYLTVAVDDFESSHMSLELNLDKYVDLQGEHASIWHDGSITVGKLGQRPRKELLDYLQKDAPQLVVDGKIILGKLNKAVEIKSGHESTIDFLNRLILYALLRDRYRRMVKGATLHTGISP